METKANTEQAQHSLAQRLETHDRRLAAVEDDMRSMKTELSDIRAMLIRIDERTENLATKETVARIDGRTSNMPTTIQLTTLVFATWAAGAGFLFLAVRFAGGG